ncbi:outer membrane protein [Chelativorans sp. Marseille-P2723]|uniref:outer membrane protein n=1 Tax=Chelativorans sp. Marseille-P2723 TaxID=2709133 RepID=UPI00156EA500|nr:outer membrane protein [Chelativorans sp. Marseille-P2723]
MQKLSSWMAATAVAVVAGAVPVSAADYDPPLVIEQTPHYVPVEVGSGWYLRGDIGYHIGTRPNAAPTFRTFDGLTYEDTAFNTARLSDELTFGFGVGYSFTDLLRADLTLDRFTSSFSGSTSTAAPCPSGPAGTACRSEDETDVTGYSAMLNGYVDLGTFVGFTPYVGAGAGFTYLRWDDLSSNYYCVDAGVPCGGVGFTDNIGRAGESDWRFTYALMAGVTYDISANLKADLGYRYKRVRGGDMFAWDEASAGAGATGVQGRDDGLSTHEVRLGLRLELW